MKLKSLVLLAVMSLAVFTGLLFSTPVRADSSDPDVTFGFTPYDTEGNEITNYPYGYEVSIEATLQSGDKLTGKYSYVDSDGNTGEIEFGNYGNAYLPIPFGKTVTLLDIPSNTTFKMFLLRIRSFSPRIRTDTAFEDYSADALDEKGEIIIDSDKTIHYKVDTTNLYTSFSICPVNYQDTWSYDDTTFKFHMSFSDLEDLDTTNFYYTVGDDGKHYLPEPGTRSNLIVDVDIPLGQKLTLHNIPTGAFFGENDYTSSEYYNIYWKSVQQKETGESLGFTDTKGDVFLSSGVVTNNTSGTWTIYLGRRSVQAVLGKVTSNTDGTNPDELYDFKVTLFDTVNDCPLTGQVEVLTGEKTEVGKYWNGDTSAQVSVRMVDLDSDGSFIISLKANELAFIGRFYNVNGKPWTRVDPGNARLYEGPHTALYCDREEGMIPVYTRFTIEELDNGYQVMPATNNADGDRTVTWLPEYVSQQYYWFDNARLYDSSLSLEKVVEGKNDKFDFTIRIKDVAGNISDSYPYTGDINGNLTFKVTGTEEGTRTAGDGRTSDITYTIYEADISLEGGQKITISDLPSGAEYEVIEKSVTGYSSASNGNTGVLVNGDVSKVIFTNTEITPSSTPAATPVITANPTPATMATPGTPTSSIVSTGESNSAYGLISWVLILLACAVIGVERRIKER